MSLSNFSIEERKLLLTLRGLNDQLLRLKIVLPLI